MVKNNKSGSNFLRLHIDDLKDEFTEEKYNPNILKE